MKERLTGRVEIRTNCRASRIMTKDEGVTGVALDNGDVVEARFVIAAPGRSGAGWIREEARRLAIPSIPSPVDIGVRVEVPAPVLAPLTEAAYEAKLIFYSRTFDDKVRTFCMNPYGEVVLEELDGLITVNGQAIVPEKHNNSNFAILVSSIFTEPFDDPISYRNISPVWPTFWAREPWCAAGRSSGRPAHHPGSSGTLPHAAHA